MTGDWVATAADLSRKVSGGRRHVGVEALHLADAVRAMTPDQRARYDDLRSPTATEPALPEIDALSPGF